MPTPDLASTTIDALINTRDARTGMRFPPPGLQPYHAWLIDSLHRLAASSAGDYLVTQDESTPTSIYVAPGRASIGGTPLPYNGGSHELATINNDTAMVWLTDNGSGSPQIGFVSAGVGWPAGDHIKLAEVTIQAGRITSILDRRFESILSA
ncbi:MAG: hypothetical protein AAGI53_17590 [Planctomycetota bacterium]